MQHMLHSHRGQSHASSFILFSCSRHTVKATPDVFSSASCLSQPLACSWLFPSYVYWSATEHTPAIQSPNLNNQQTKNKINIPSLIQRSCCVLFYVLTPVFVDGWTHLASWLCNRHYLLALLSPFWPGNSYLNPLESSGIHMYHLL